MGDGALKEAFHLQKRGEPGRSRKWFWWEYSMPCALRKRRSTESLADVE